jgi:hypothetical protein
MAHASVMLFLVHKRHLQCMAMGPPSWLFNECTGDAGHGRCAPLLVPGGLPAPSKTFTQQMAVHTFSAFGYFCPCQNLMQMDLTHTGHLPPSLAGPFANRFPASSLDHLPSSFVLFKERPGRDRSSMPSMMPRSETFPSTPHHSTADCVCSGFQISSLAGRHGSVRLGGSICIKLAH